MSEPNLDQNAPNPLGPSQEEVPEQFKVELKDLPEDTFAFQAPEIIDET